MLDLGVVGPVESDYLYHFTGRKGQRARLGTGVDSGHERSGTPGQHPAREAVPGVRAVWRDYPVHLLLRMPARPPQVPHRRRPVLPLGHRHPPLRDPQCRRGLRRLRPRTRYTHASRRPDSRAGASARERDRPGRTNASGDFPGPREPSESGTPKRSSWATPAGGRRPSRPAGGTRPPGILSPGKRPARTPSWSTNCPFRGGCRGYGSGTRVRRP